MGAESVIPSSVMVNGTDSPAGLIGLFMTDAIR